MMVYFTGRLDIACEEVDAKGYPTPAARHARKMRLFAQHHAGNGDFAPVQKRLGVDNYEYRLIPVTRKPRSTAGLNRLMAGR